MIDHFVLISVLEFSWYVTNVIVQAGREQFHTIFTVFAPYALPSYAYYFQARSRYNFSLKQWVSYTLIYWVLLLGTRDLLEHITVGLPLLDDLFTVLRILLAVSWFSMFREGLAGSIHNIRYLITTPFSLVSTMLSAVFQAFVACCRWMAAWEMDAVSDGESKPPIQADGDNEQVVNNTSAPPEVIQTANASNSDATPVHNDNINRNINSNAAGTAENTNVPVASSPGANPGQDGNTSEPENNKPNDINTSESPDEGPVASTSRATPVQADVEKEKTVDDAAGQPDNVLNYLSFFRIAFPPICALLYYCGGLTGFLSLVGHFLGPLWAMTLLQLETLRNLSMHTLRSLRNAPDRATFLLLAMLHPLANLNIKLAVINTEAAASDRAHWVVNNLLPALFTLRWEIFHLMSGIILVAFAVKNRNSMTLHNLLVFLRTSVEHGFGHAARFAGVNIGSPNRVPPFFFSAYGIVHAALFNAGLFSPGTFSIRDTLAALFLPAILSVRDAIIAVVIPSGTVSAIVGGRMHELLIATGISRIILGQSCSYHLVSTILACGAALVAIAVTVIHQQPRSISSWLLILTTVILVITAPQISTLAFIWLTLVWAMVALAYCLQRYLAPRTVAFLVRRYVTMIQELKQLDLLDVFEHQVEDVVSKRYLPFLGVFVLCGCLKGLILKMTLVFSTSGQIIWELTVWYTLLAAATFLLAHWYYRRGLPNANPPVPGSWALSHILPSILVFVIGSLAFATFTSFPHFNPYAVLGFPTGFRFTDVDLRQAYRFAARPFLAGGEQDAWLQAKQGAEAYSMLADPDLTCAYLARYNTPIWNRSHAKRRCDEDATAVVGPPAEMPYQEVDLWIDEEIVVEYVVVGQVCYVDGHEVPCEDPASSVPFYQTVFDTLKQTFV